MILRTRFFLTIITGFAGTMLFGIINKFENGPWPNIWPDTAQIVASIITAFAFTLVMIMFNREFGKKWYFIGIVGLLLSVILGFTTEVWPAENNLKEDLTTIMQEAENWPVIEETLWEDVNIITKIRQNPNNSNEVLMSKMVLNRNQPELFAKLLFTTLLNHNDGFYLNK